MKKRLSGRFFVVYVIFVNRNCCLFDGPMWMIYALSGWFRVIRSLVFTYSEIMR